MYTNVRQFAQNCTPTGKDSMDKKLGKVSVASRPRGKCWYAVFKYGRHTVRKSTGVPVEPQPFSGMTKTQAKNKALTKAYQIAEDYVNSLEEKKRGDKLSIRSFLETVEVGGQEKAREDNRRNFQEFIQWLGKEADAPLASLGWEKCLAYLGYLMQSGLAFSTVRLKRGQLATVFKIAQRDDLISKNPWEFATMREVRSKYAPEQRAGRKSDREPFSLEELRILFTKLPQPWQDLAAVSFYTGGQRLGDCCMLTWNAVDLEKREIRLITQKTKLGMCIPITSVLLLRLQRMRAEAAEGEEYVFPLFADIVKRNNGKTSRVSNAFTNLIRGLGIIPAISQDKVGRGHNTSSKSFHSIRHSVASLMATGGVPEAVGMATVGHGSKAVHDAYVTVGREKKEEALQLLPVFS